MTAVACWKVKGASAYASGDAITGCNTKDGSFTGTAGNGGEHFNPLMQGSGNANSYVRVAADATTAKGTFADGTSNDISITGAMQAARARAQANLWFADWVLTALDEDWVLTGKEANRTTEAGATWNGRTLGAAEVVETSKIGLLAAAEKEKLAVIQWQSAAATEAAAAVQDLVRARALLEDLTQEIAPLARAEA